MNALLLATLAVANVVSVSTHELYPRVPLGAYLAMELDGKPLRVYYDSLVVYEFENSDGSIRQLVTCRVDIQEESWFPILVEFDINTEEKSFLGHELVCTPTELIFVPPPA